MLVLNGIDYTAFRANFCFFGTGNIILFYV